MQRDPALADNAALPAALLQRAGDRLYQGLWAGYSFGGEEGVRVASAPCNWTHGEFCATDFQRWMQGSVCNDYGFQVM